MFNNPFESFHDTVAEAKEEREHLDQLLIISTPKERVLALLVFVTLLAFASWLVFGSVAQRISVEGIVIGVIDGRSGQSRVQVLALSEHDGAETVVAGMAAVVRLDGLRDTPESISGRVEISDELPMELETGENESAAFSVPRLDVAIYDEHDFTLSSLVGEKCIVVVEIGRQSPIQLIGAGLF